MHLPPNCLLIMQLNNVSLTNTNYTLKKNIYITYITLITQIFTNNVNNNYINKNGNKQYTDRY